jgi:hypothetical protein
MYSFNIQEWPQWILDKILHLSYTEDKTLFATIISTGRVSDSAIRKILDYDTDIHNYTRFESITRIMPNECMRVLQSDLGDRSVANDEAIRSNISDIQFDTLPKTLTDWYITNGGKPADVAYSLLVHAVKEQDVASVTICMNHVSLSTQAAMVRYILLVDHKVDLLVFGYEMWKCLLTYAEANPEDVQNKVAEVVVKAAYLKCMDATKHIRPIDAQHSHLSLTNIRSAWYSIYPTRPISLIDHMSSILGSRDNSGMYDVPPTERSHDALFAIQHHCHTVLQKVIQVMQYERMFEHSNISLFRKWLTYAVEMHNAAAVHILHPLVFGEQLPLRSRTCLYGNRYPVEWPSHTLIFASQVLPCFSPGLIHYSWFRSGNRVHAARKQKWCIPGHVTDVYDSYLRCLAPHLSDDLCRIVLQLTRFHPPLMNQRAMNMRATIWYVLKRKANTAIQSYDRVLAFCGYK